MTNQILYITGKTPCGKPLLGGVWRMFTQDGFPVEMSHILATQRGCLVDWCEAMLDAKESGTLPALVRQMECFLPQEAMAHIKERFVVCVACGLSVNDKRKAAG